MNAVSLNFKAIKIKHSFCLFSRYFRTKTSQQPFCSLFHPVMSLMESISKMAGNKKIIFFCQFPRIFTQILKPLKSILFAIYPKVRYQYRIPRREFIEKYSNDGHSGFLWQYDALSLLIHEESLFCFAVFIRRLWFVLTTSTIAVSRRRLA